MGELGIVVRGAKDCEAALTAMDARINVATLKALKASQTAAKAAVKSAMRGRPRWDHRGKSKRTGPDVSLHLTPHHVSKGGGPGKLTGRLYGAVGVVKRPKPLPEGGFKGGVGCGGKDSVTNNYRTVIEAQYPYMKPGIKKAEPKMAVVWQAAWAKAIR
ncbi:hypothetical protein CG740_37250 [Streptomyces sp. CB01201]|uniref:hypothetical protein n=1 Tax=Streptomyces sp. CB01201 TaxID=2020324 RepID=UPI000C27AE1E|nr:hypothetical protein [Streptomyces sp. CB01201]PJM98133.1 hypothetical protein CG740_37250 [Streptomyces sp. CB01201]